MAKPLHGCRNRMPPEPQRSRKLCPLPEVSGRLNPISEPATFRTACIASAWTSLEWKDACIVTPLERTTTRLRLFPPLVLFALTINSSIAQQPRYGSDDAAGHYVQVSD